MASKANFNRRTRMNAGVTLIEVMVSILILSIALIGIAGMQAATIRFQLGSESRSAVSTLLNDISGRMRINLTQVPGYSTSTKYLVADTWADQHATTPTASSKLCGTESAAEVCTASERADYDLYVWRTAARTALPQGSVQLAGNVDLGMTVTLMWYDKDFREGHGASEATLKTSPTCTTTVNTLGTADFGQATMRRQTCCPAAAAAAAGVRCANFTVVP